MRVCFLPFLFVFLLGICGCGDKEDETIILRVSNWEEYMDQGDWDEDSAIEFSDGTVLLAQNSLIEDFEDWFEETYGRSVKVEYSTFGTNEELYNQITLGDVYDVVCPSEYMIMKMMKEEMLVPFSEDFHRKELENNFYVNNVSPYIADIYANLNIGGETLDKYAAGYMWGTLGIVYNPEEVTEEEASCWDILRNEKFAKRITVKDSVRDAYYSAVSIYYYDLISTDAFKSSPDYKEQLTKAVNATDKETVDGVEEILSDIKQNVYSFETDSGKADMVTGKVVANQQWSGDAVYTMDQAEEDGIELSYAIPRESTNLWFDGWVMLRCGVEGDADKQMAAEAFVNYMAKPESAVRNMDYIGYTSVISGGDSDYIIDYINWNYGVEDEEEESVDYDISYFFGDKEVIVTTSLDQTTRQLYAQYPSQEVMNRSAVMEYFDKESNERINRMWTNVRCFDIKRWFQKLIGE